MELDERIQLLQEAIDMVTEASDMVSDAIHGTGLEAHYKSYGSYGFDTLLGGGNRYNRSLLDLEKGLYELQEEESE